MRRVGWLLGVFILNGPASADQLSRGVQDVAIIQDGAGAARVLFKLDPPGDLGRVVIGRASFTFGLAGTAETRVIRLRVHPVTTAWTAGTADWTHPWSRPGGDFEEDLYSVVELDLSRATIDVDLTPILKEVLEEGMFADGFLVTVDPADGTGIRVEDLARFQALEAGSVGVSYRKVSPRPRELS